MITSNKDIVIVGYSGHSYVVADILTELGYCIKGYFDKEPAQRNLLNIPYLGFEGNATDLKKIESYAVFPSIGDNSIRRKVFEQFATKGFLIPTIISSRANISGLSTMAEGTLVCNGACINAFAQIGRGVILNTGSIIEHECEISDFVHVAPGAVLAGNVKIGAGSFIGANSVVKQGVTIGKNTIVGAGSVVLKDIEDNQVWVGNPAKRLLK